MNEKERRKEERLKYWRMKRKRPEGRKKGKGKEERE